MTDIVIIGGGASGMVCAIETAKAGLKVVLLEKMDRVGKKLLATGNGRCNLMNTGAPAYFRGADFAEEVLRTYGAERQKAFWKGLGLALRQEEAGRVYPASLQASTVLDVLRLAMERAGVQVYTGEKAVRIDAAEHGYEIRCESGSVFRSRRVVVAGGGCAQPKLGSDGSAAGLLRQLGHTVRRFTPVLTALYCDTKYLSGLSGIRVKARVTAEQDRRAVYQEDGEVLFTDNGLSGVCIMNCSGCLKDENASVVLDLLTSLGYATPGEMQDELARRRREWKDQPLEQLLTGLTVPRLAANLMRAAGITTKGRMTGSLREEETRRLAEVMSCFRVQVTGRRGFEQAQVARGGADPSEFDASTMGSRKRKGLYALGEVLDVDGQCGGFHLMFAFGCALAAAEAIKENQYDHQ